MPAVRQPDVVRVEVIGDQRVASGVLENFTSLVIRNDITMPSEASFELGDDGTWNSLGPIFEPGTDFAVFVNDRPRLRGRVEMNDVPFDAQAGATVRFTVRTKLSDAMFASAGQKTRVKNTSIKDFILDLYAPLGYDESDFILSAYTSRDIFTGRDKGETGSPSELDRIKVSEARVKPPESIYAAADRHLRRHGLMHWDSPDGRIVVAAPDDEQDETYTFNMYRGTDSYLNNVIGSTRTRDWSAIPAVVGVYGRGGKRDFTKSRIAALAVDEDVLGAGFYRPVTIIAESIRTQDLANAAAHRELVSRSKRKDAFSINVDGWSSWDGQQGFLYSPDTVARVNTDVAGGDGGPYYVHAISFTRDASGGDSCQLSMVRRGIWRLQ